MDTKTPFVSDERIVQNAYDDWKDLFDTDEKVDREWADGFKTGHRKGQRVTRSIYEAELQALRDRVEKMETAARNVLSRWDSPDWEWDKHGHTAGLMADLRNTLPNKP